MKKLSIITLLLLFSITIFSTTQVGAWGFDDGGAGGGVSDPGFTYSPVPAESIYSKGSWTANVNALNFDYNNYNYLDDVILLDGKTYIPLRSSGNYIYEDECSQLSGYNLMEGEAYTNGAPKAAERFILSKAEYYNAGFRGNYHLNDTYFQSNDVTHKHDVYEKYDKCMPYYVVESTYYRASNNEIIHWEYIADETTSIIEQHIYYIEIGEFFRLVSIEITTYMSEHQISLLEVLTAIVSGTVSGALTCLIPLLNIPFTALGYVTGAQTWIDFMVTNNLQTFQDMRDILLTSQNQGNFIALSFGFELQYNMSPRSTAYAYTTNLISHPIKTGIKNNQYYGSIDSTDISKDYLLEIISDYYQAVLDTSFYYDVS